MRRGETKQKENEEEKEREWMTKIDWDGIFLGYVFREIVMDL